MSSLQELLRAAELGALGISSMKPQVGGSQGSWGAVYKPLGILKKHRVVVVRYTCCWMGWVGWKKSPQKITKQPVVEVEMVVEISSWFNAGFYKFYAFSQVGCLGFLKHQQYLVLMMVPVVGASWPWEYAIRIRYCMNRTDSENNLQWAENRNIKSHNLPTHQILFYTLTLTIFFNKKYFQCPLRNIHKQTKITNNPNVFVLISIFGSSTFLDITFFRWSWQPSCWDLQPSPRPCEGFSSLHRR